MPNQQSWIWKIKFHIHHIVVNEIQINDEMTCQIMDSWYSRLSIKNDKMLNYNALRDFYTATANDSLWTGCQIAVNN